MLTISPVRNYNDSAHMLLNLVVKERIYKRNLLQEQCTDIIHKYITICIRNSQTIILKAYSNVKLL